jgi:hypothetical protein
MTASSQPSDS